MKLPPTLIHLLQDLVAIPSVNPDGEPGTDRVGEQALAEYVADFLRTLGAEAELVPVLEGRPNVIATFPIDKPASAKMAFGPHLDTVSVGGMTISPFDPVIKDGRLFGRGSTDTKGPMAAALWAMKEWASSEQRLKSTVQWSFYGFMGEEAGNDGALAMAAKPFDCDLILVLEPTQMGVLTAHKGVLWMEVTTHGVACHGAVPQNGRNAISAMSRVIQMLENEVVPLLAEQSDPRLGPTTLNIGLIKGGRKINIVPDECLLQLDCRFILPETREKITEMIRSKIKAIEPSADFAPMRSFNPLRTDESLPWVAKLGELNAHHGRGFTTAPWFSDAAILGAPGRPAVCMGPGRTEDIHTKDEFIRLADLETGFQFFREWMLTV